MKEQYILVTEFCRGHSLEESFILKLEEYELIRLETYEGEMGFPQSELTRLERLIRLNRELKINPPGLQAVHHLLDKMESLQAEVQELKRRLKRWED